jgi:hypothetical protein
MLSGFDPGSELAWCELLRDIVAVANSGGGVVRLSLAQSTAGHNGAGLISAEGIRQRLSEVADSGIESLTVRMPAIANDMLEIVVGPAAAPIGFKRTASCDTAGRLADKRPAFTAGQFFFRRGDRSVAGSSADIDQFYSRKLSRLRRHWMRGIRQVLSRSIEPDAAAAANQSARRGNEISSASEALHPVRIVSDPAAPALQPQYVDRLYPWRQKELMEELNHRLGRRMLTTYDVQAVRRQHNLDERPDFVFHLPGAGRRYSPAVADWIMNQVADDTEFFQRAHAADQAMLRLRRQRPR